MNSKLKRVGIAVLLLGTTWGLGYFVGITRSSSGSGEAARIRFPIPASDFAAERSSSLSSTPIGRLIDGKSDFQRQQSLYQYAASLDREAMIGAVNEAMQ